VSSGDRSNGSVYVVAVISLLVAYFTYQWWFNPNRVIKRRLGELANVLSIPAHETELARIARAAALRRYFSDDVHVRLGSGRSELASRDALIGAASGWTPPPAGVNVDFVDVQVSTDTDSTARAYFSVEISSHDRRTAEATFESRDASLMLLKQGADWVISEAEVKDPPTIP